MYDFASKPDYKTNRQKMSEALSPMASAGEFIQQMGMMSHSKLGST